MSGDMRNVIRSRQSAGARSMFRMNEKRLGYKIAHRRASECRRHLFGRIAKPKHKQKMCFFGLLSSHCERQAAALRQR